MFSACHSKSWETFWLFFFKHLHVSLRNTLLQLCKCSKYRRVAPRCYRPVMQPRRCEESRRLAVSVTLFNPATVLSPHRSSRSCRRSVCCRRPVPSTTCPITPESLRGCRDTSCSLTRRGERFTPYT